MTLTAYVLRIVALRILGAGAILIAILQILDLIDVTPEILARGQGVEGIAYYAALHLPRLLEQVLPLAVLAGGLFAFAQLGRESAVIAMRAAGVSVYRLFAMAAPAALAVMAIDYATVELVAPRTDARLEAWWEATAPPTEEPEKPRMFRAGADLVVGRGDIADPTRLTDVRIYRRDAQGGLATRTEAPLAIHGEGGWRLMAPKITRFGADGVFNASAAEAAWDTRLAPADLQALLSSDQAPSGAASRRALAGGGAERPASYYAMRLQKAFAGPLAALVMLLLATPVALGSFRSSEGALAMTLSLAAGLLYMVADGVLVALGEGAVLSPLLAAWTAPAVFSALALSVLLRMEG